MRLAPNFTLDEFSVSASFPELAGPVPAYLADRVRRLAWYVLQPIRDALDAPMRITSGWRSPALNAAVGGSPTSQHLRGEAADWTVDGWPIAAAWRVVRELVADGHLPDAGQLIVYPRAQFIHTALASPRFPSPTTQIHAPTRGYRYHTIAPDHADAWGAAMRQAVRA